MNWIPLVDIQMNWSALIVFFALGLLGLWVAYSFLNLKGLYLFSILAVMLSVLCAPVSMFSQTISISCVFMPLAYFCLLVCHIKFGKDETKKMFILSLTTLVVLFVTIFLQSAYLDASVGFSQFLSWRVLGGIISAIIAYLAAYFVTVLLADKVTTAKVSHAIQLAIFVALASTIDNFIFVVFSGIGIISFWGILVSLLLRVVISCVVSIGLGYFEMCLNRQLAVKVVQSENKKQEDKTEEQKEVKEEIKKEESSQEKRTEEENKKGKVKKEKKQEVKEEIEVDEEINYDSSAS